MSSPPPRAFPFAAALAVLATSAVAQVTSVAIPATADASIYVLDGWGCGAMVLDRANGAGQYIAASYDDCTDEHHAFGLIRFDVAGALPAGATIVSARV